MTERAQMELGSLLRSARQSLHALPSAGPAGAGPAFAGPAGAGQACGGAAPGAVHVALRRDGRLRGAMTSRQPDLAAAVAEAVRMAAASASPPVCADEIGRIVLEIWVETGSVRMPPDGSVLERDIRLGVDGIFLSVDGREATYRPSAAIRDPFGSVADLLRRLCRKLGLAEDAWTAHDAVIRRSTWVHAVEAPDHPHGFIRLERMRPMPNPAIGRDRVAAAIRACVGHLLTTQRADGSLGYQYDPLRDQWACGDSRVRAAGCAYALARSAAHDLTASIPGLQDGALRLLAYLQANLVQADAGPFLPENDPDRVWGKLGATALFLLALDHLPPEAGFAPTARRLHAVVQDCQRPDGSFACRFADDSEKDAEQDYFPGEALLALARSGAPPSLHAIAAAFGAYRARFRRAPVSAFVPWQAEAWAALWHCLPPAADPACPAPTRAAVAAFVFAQIDWLLALQHGQDETVAPHMRGGFIRPGIPTIGSSSHLEAILHGMQLAGQVGDAVRVRRYRDAARACLRFVLDLQVPPECAFLFPAPLRIVGAAAGSPIAFRFRCDFDQHFITSLLTAYDTHSLWRDD